MPKKKNQSWNFKNPDDKANVSFSARFGPKHKGAHRVARVLWMNSKAHKDTVRRNAVLADHDRMNPGFLDALEARRKADLAVVVSELCEAASDGNGDAFRQLANCVDFIGTHEKHGAWADPLAQRIFEYTQERWIEALVSGHSVSFAPFMKTAGYFNIDDFMDWSQSAQDRKTITKRVRLMGYRVKTGRPKGTTKRTKR